MWVIGPYEAIWITAALVFLFFGPPLAGVTLAAVRAWRKRRAERRGSSSED